MSSKGKFHQLPRMFKHIKTVANRDMHAVKQLKTQPELTALVKVTAVTELFSIYFILLVLGEGIEMGQISLNEDT